MVKTKIELEKELKYLESESKRMDVEEKVKAKRMELIKRKYKGFSIIKRIFAK